MLSGVTARACETTGTAVFKIVVSRDSIKKATATNQGSSRFAESGGEVVFEPVAGNRIPWSSIEPL